MKQLPCLLFAVTFACLSYRSSSECSGVDCPLFRSLQEDGSDILSDKLAQDPELSVMFAMMEQSGGLASTANGNSKVTMFVPTNEAMEDFLGSSSPSSLLQLRGARTAFKRMIEYHVIPQELTVGDLVEGASFETVEGQDLKFSVSASDNSVTLNGRVKLLSSGTSASDGTFFKIDKMLIPPTLRGAWALLGPSSYAEELKAAQQQEGGSVFVDPIEVPVPFTTQPIEVPVPNFASVFPPPSEGVQSGDPSAPAFPPSSGGTVTPPAAGPDGAAAFPPSSGTTVNPPTTTADGAAAFPPSSGTTVTPPAPAAAPATGADGTAAFPPSAGTTVTPPVPAAAPATAADSTAAFPPSSGATVTPPAPAAAPATGADGTAASPPSVGTTVTPPVPAAAPATGADSTAAFPPSSGTTVTPPAPATGADGTAAFPPSSGTTATPPAPAAGAEGTAAFPPSAGGTVTPPSSGAAVTPPAPATGPEGTAAFPPTSGGTVTLPTPATGPDGTAAFPPPSGGTHTPPASTGSGTPAFPPSPAGTVTLPSAPPGAGTPPFPPSSSGTHTPPASTGGGTAAFPPSSGGTLTTPSTPAGGTPAFPPGSGGTLTPPATAGAGSTPVFPPQSAGTPSTPGGGRPAFPPSSDGTYTAPGGPASTPAFPPGSGGTITVPSEDGVCVCPPSSCDAVAVFPPGSSTASPGGTPVFPPGSSTSGRIPVFPPGGSSPGGISVFPPGSGTSGGPAGSCPIPIFPPGGSSSSGGIPVFPPGGSSSGGIPVFPPGGSGGSGGIPVFPPGGSMTPGGVPVFPPGSSTPEGAVPLFPSGNTTTSTPRAPTDPPKTCPNITIPSANLTGTVGNTLAGQKYSSTFGFVASILGLLPELNHPWKNVTVFAPSDAAMKLPAEKLFALLFERPELARWLFSFSIVPEALTIEQLQDLAQNGSSIETLAEGAPLSVFENLLLNNQSCVQWQGKAINGFVYSIDELLVPNFLQFTINGLLNATEESPYVCTNDPLVATTGADCLMAATYFGCEARLADMVEGLGIGDRLPAAVPPIITVSDACPITCQSCLPGSVKNETEVAEGFPPSTCSNDPRLFFSGFSCQDLKDFLPQGCDTELGFAVSLGGTELPEGIPSFARLSEACPVTCDSCPPGREIVDAPCIDADSPDGIPEAFPPGLSCFDLVQSFACNELMFDVIDNLGIDVDYPIGFNAEVKSLCPATCDMCPANSSVQGTPPRRPLLNNCTDNPLVPLMGLSCEEALEKQNCTDTINGTVLGVTIPPGVIPDFARVELACPVQCDTCPEGRTPSPFPCIDVDGPSSPAGAAALLPDGITCKLLTDTFSCNATLAPIMEARNLSTANLPSQDLKVHNLCAATCRECPPGSEIYGTPPPPPPDNCTDNLLLAFTGFDCGFNAISGIPFCDQPLFELMETLLEINPANVPPGLFPSFALGEDACPVSCGTCPAGREEVDYPCLDINANSSLIPQAIVPPFADCFLLVQYFDCEDSVQEIADKLKLDLGDALVTWNTIVASICPAMCDSCPMGSKIYGEPPERPNTSNCSDNPLIPLTGLSCQNLKSVAGCDANLLDTAQQRGLSLPPGTGIPDFAQVSQACPVTCGSCPRGREEVPFACINADYASVPAAVQTLLPDGVSCELLVQTFACNATLGPLLEARNITVDVPLPPWLSVQDLCAASCRACPEGSEIFGEPPPPPPDTCMDNPLLGFVGFDCSFLTMVLGDSFCDANLLDVAESQIGLSRDRIPPGVFPSFALGKDACPVSCNACPAGRNATEFPCLDIDSNSTLIPPAVVPDFADCYLLVTYFECSEYITDIAEHFSLNLNDTMVTDFTSVASICPAMCDQCPPGSKIYGEPPERPPNVCENNPLVTDLGFTCCDVVQYFGCKRPLKFFEEDLNLTVPWSASVPEFATTREACMVTCEECKEGAEIVPQVPANCSIPDTCRDNPLLFLAGWSCADLVAEAGCDANLMETSKRLGFFEFLPEDIQQFTVARVAEACQVTCDNCPVERPEGDTLCIDVDGGPPVPSSLANLLPEGTSCFLLVRYFNCFEKVQDIIDELGIDMQGQALPPNITVQNVCAATCDECPANFTIEGEPPKRPENVCQNDPLVEELGFECWQIAEFFGCDERLSTIADEFNLTLNESQVPYFARVQEACPLTCANCKVCSEMPELPPFVCQDNELVDSLGATCDLLVDFFSCDELLSTVAADFGYTLPSLVPELARVRLLCQLTCDACPRGSVPGNKTVIPPPQIADIMETRPELSTIADLAKSTPNGMRRLRMFSRVTVVIPNDRAFYKGGDLPPGVPVFGEEQYDMFIAWLKRPENRSYLDFILEFGIIPVRAIKPEDVKPNWQVGGLTAADLRPVTISRRERHPKEFYAMSYQYGFDSDRTFLTPTSIDPFLPYVTGAGGTENDLDFLTRRLQEEADSIGKSFTEYQAAGGTYTDLLEHVNEDWVYEIDGFEAFHAYNASNGILWVIDGIRTPKWFVAPPLVEFVTNMPGMSKLQYLLEESGAYEEIQQRGPLTFFLLADTAFVQPTDGNPAPPCVLEALAMPSGATALAKTLRYLTVPGIIWSANLTDGTVLKNFGGEELKVSRVKAWPGSVSLPDALMPPHLNGEFIYLNDKLGITTVDQRVANGLVHVIDTLPEVPGVDQRVVAYWQCLDGVIRLAGNLFEIVVKILFNAIDHGDPIPILGPPPSVRPNWVGAGTDGWFPPPLIWPVRKDMERYDYDSP
uniref:FAS1 domain-containing protein n=1 Tax=Chromera velia CCMP2878 TaxID=1169474 RepID=A0A0G4HG26_9ALVE|eukprot:Cvel_6662.t1-p1 / transcript=Cvel_6662.t1 / gene=Cvel_6662 / organism=Chromera_velia_CCMP2878 / gene_product=Transforming growth factor-beta-induced protein, putative / transcript_product=Transforming growth factor-beta-induced protein, putative / location=Cvel_scaffold331:12379-21712(+) / protein_length=2731 / sequence_SO=supercontig / SO=protein_coding / is_pseudo=false